MYEGDVSYYNRLRYYPEEGYFNAGVLLINVDFWRDNMMEKVFLEYAADNSDRIFHHDQDILNFTLKDVKGRLPLKYNVQDGFLYTERHFLEWPCEEELKEAQTHPALVHFTGRFKPWSDMCNHPWKADYLAAARSFGISQREFPEIKADRMSPYQKMRSMLVRLGIIAPTLIFDSTIKPLQV